MASSFVDSKWRLAEAEANMTSCKTCSTFRHKLNEAESMISRLRQKHNDQDKFIDDMTTAQIELYHAAQERTRSLPKRQLEAETDNVNNDLPPTRDLSTFSEACDAMKRDIDELDKMAGGIPGDQATACKQCVVLRQKLKRSNAQIACLRQNIRYQDEISDKLMKTNCKLWETSNEAPRLQRSPDRGIISTSDESENEDEQTTNANNNLPPGDPPSSPDEARDALMRFLDELDEEEANDNNLSQNQANAAEP